ncbi:unnamed protein product [Musa acuminata subsp. malaccensis]|uniref:(wild Malaysian banana) hypothetical protein n=1 Tax=Musa acuminata subsp. malaccensis TaxID=214687 RepID=A0A804L5X4_MUSAM|nr:unnamed protein product [Musa acuminata subsp. malaccensis]
MASIRPSYHLFASVDSRSSSDLSDRRNGGKNLSYPRRLIANSNAHEAPSEPIAATVAPVTENSSRALVKVAFLGLSRKLYQKGGTAERKAEKALTEVNTNTRTIAMALRRERDLLAQNKEYEAKISELRLLIDEKNEEVEKLKDLCVKQREELKALKDAILFPDVMNSQLQVLLEKQGFELKQAKQVRTDKYTSRTCFDEHLSSPRTPISDQQAANPLEYRSPDCMASDYGSPDEMFLKDLNPCLTPCFSKLKPQGTTVP